MTTPERIESALAFLEGDEGDLAGSPAATVIMPPDSGEFIIGNATGFIRLAVASLKAAKGEKQSFKDHTWWVDYELDWTLPGLKLDPDAHVYLPPKNTGLRLVWKKIWGYGAPISVVVCLTVGAITIIRWIARFL